MAVVGREPLVLDLRIPERAHPTGPVVRRRLQRTAAGLVAVWCVGAATAYGASSAGLLAFGTGLLVPGAGFAVGVDNPVVAGVLTALTLVAFLVALVAWFGSGNILAPPLVWLLAAIGASVLAGTERLGARDAVVALVVAGVVAGVALRARGVHTARGRARRRNRRLATVHAVPRTGKAAAAGEMGAEDLAHVRHLIDLAMQPLDEFRGFDIVDQFQTAAIRYQINFAQYALATAQAVRTPAFTGYLSEAQRRLIEKTTVPRVWRYWRWENLWGNLDTNPDPMARDNIMLSGYLGLMVGMYASNTGDLRFAEPGALSFRLNDRREFLYDHEAVLASVERGFGACDLGLFPCEPNWVYSSCNLFGMNALLAGDRVLGTAHARRVQESFRRGFDEEFTTIDGRVTMIRSSRLGLTIPSLTSTIGDAMNAVIAEPALPETAERCWQILRDEFVRITDAGADITLRGWDRIDVGNYRLEPVSPYVVLFVAARERGDDELADLMVAEVERRFEPSTSDGRRWYARASTNMNAFATWGRVTRERAFLDQIRRGPDETVRRGPRLAEAPYPECLVASADTDGDDLRLVLRPGDAGGRVALGVERLAPGRSYDLVGALEQEIVAGPSGTAALHVDLDGRREVTLRRRA